MIKKKKKNPSPFPTSLRNLGSCLSRAEGPRKECAKGNLVRARVQVPRVRAAGRMDPPGPRPVRCRVACQVPAEVSLVLIGLVHMGRHQAVGRPVEAGPR